MKNKFHKKSCYFLNVGYPLLDTQNAKTQYHQHIFFFQTTVFYGCYVGVLFVLLSSIILRRTNELNRIFNVMKKILVVFFIGLVSFSNMSAQDSDGKTVALETIGVLSSVAMYNSYLAIGAIADGLGTTYEAESVIMLMNEQSSFLDNTVKQMNALQATDFLDDGDKAFVGKVSECVNYLKNQANAMAIYAKSNSQSDLDSYNFYRDRAWNMIEDLLGLNED